MLVVLDSYLDAKYRAQRERTDGWRWDEVWDGDYFIMPLPDNTYHDLLSGFATVLVLESGVGTDRRAMILPGVVVSNLRAYRSNFR